MSRTTDARQAIQDLLESSDPETVVQYDGITYRVAPSGDKRERFYEILTQRQASNKLNCEEAKSLLQMLSGPHKTFDPLERVAGWMQSESEGWFRSARYNASLEATDSDQEYPTSK